MNRKTNLILCLMLTGLFAAFGQMEEYTYKRTLSGNTALWNRLELPPAIFSKISDDLSDIRIVGITEKGDTIQAPYLLQILDAKPEPQAVAFKILNTTKNKKGYYFTLEIPTAEPINQIQLDFLQKNFDWRLTLEGSQDQVEWFTITERYRILSIHTAQTNYEFTKIHFPSASYRYFRICIASSRQPDLLEAVLLQKEMQEGQFNQYNIKKTTRTDNSESGLSELLVELDMPVPLNQIKLAVADTLDYYRTVTIQYLGDSVKTEKGWKYSYFTVASGTLTSFEDNTFTFPQIVARKLKITIQNRDNQLLDIQSIEALGYKHELIVRITEPATYYLIYGNPRAYAAQYDIARFADKIPEQPTPLTLGEEQLIPKIVTPTAQPIFENKIWLWSIMGLIILLLGWFSLRMMGSRDHTEK